MRTRRTGVSIEGSQIGMSNGRAVIPGRERDEVAIKTIGIGEDRRSPRKNLDEVSILVAEAGSTLFVSRTGDENSD